MEAFKELLGIATNAEAIYWIFAITGSFLLMLRVILRWFGGDADADVDGDFDTDGDGGGVINLNTIIAFLKSLGWVGVISYRLTTFSNITIFAIALLSGIATFVITVVLLRKIRQFESSGNLDYDNAIGKTGVVYLSIPANEQTGGQIQIHFQGRLITTDARTDGKAIPTGQKVIVYDRRENILWVQPVEDIDI